MCAGTALSLACRLSDQTFLTRFLSPGAKKPRLEARLPHDWVPLEGGDYSRLRDPSQRRHSTAMIPGLSK